MYTLHSPIIRTRLVLYVSDYLRFPFFILLNSRCFVFFFLFHSGVLQSPWLPVHCRRKKRGQWFLREPPTPRGHQPLGPAFLPATRRGRGRRDAQGLSGKTHDDRWRNNRNKDMHRDYLERLTTTGESKDKATTSYCSGGHEIKSVSGLFLVQSFRVCFLGIHPVLLYIYWYKTTEIHIF